MKRVLLTHPRASLANYFGAEARARLEAVATVVTNPGEAPWEADGLLAAARDCDVVIADRSTAVPAAVFAGLPRLLALCRCAVDYRNVDVAAASAAGVLVTHCSAGFQAAVAEWIVGAMIDLSRGIGALNAAFHAQPERPPAPSMGRELRGATLGIIGYGAIGRYLAGLGVAFGMRVIVADPYAAIDRADIAARPLPALLGESDYVVCLAVATPATENLIDAAALAAMRPGALFVNASRGNLVDEAALLAALDAGRIAGCALDVGRASDQMPSPALAAHPRVIATPHIGGLTPPAIDHQALEVVAQAAEIVAGRIPVGAVNAAAARRLGTGAASGGTGAAPSGTGAAPAGTAPNQAGGAASA
ncbi:MAG: NAD(P)-dependent oxidoreductase [Lautropia sp.]